MLLKLQPPQYLAPRLAEIATRNAEMFGDWYSNISSMWQKVPPEQRDRIAGWRVAIGGTEVHVVQCMLSEVVAAEAFSDNEAMATLLPAIVGFLEKQPLPDGFEVVHMYPSRRMVEELKL